MLHKSSQNGTWKGLGTILGKHLGVKIWRFGGFGTVWGAFWPQVVSKAKKHQKRQRYIPPIGRPFATKNEPNLAKGRSRDSKVHSGTHPEGESDFGRLFGAARGGPCAPNIVNNVSNSHRALVPKDIF